MEKWIHIFIIFFISISIEATLNETMTLQLGSDIKGGFMESLGKAVSLNEDGSVLAIGVKDANDSRGYVSIYEWSGLSWEQLGDNIYGEAQGDQSGYSVSLSSDGTIVAIGSKNNNNYRGHVRIYQWNGSSWDQVGEDIDGEDTNDKSGCAVSLSSDGTIVAIGALLNDNVAANAGHVRIYQWTESSWQQLGEDIDGEGFLDYLGFSVSLSSDGSIVAIGASKASGATDPLGKVRIFQWNGSYWEQIGDGIDGEDVNDGTGRSVSLSSDGTIVALGIHRATTPGGTLSGRVRIYQYNGISWNQLGDDIDGISPQEYLGSSVSMFSSYTAGLGHVRKVAIGVPKAGPSGTFSGQVRVYQYVLGDQGTWDWNQTVEIDGIKSGDQLGWENSIFLSKDGSRIAVGAPFYEEPLGDSDGHVRVFEFISERDAINRLVNQISSLQDSLNSISVDNSMIASNTANILSASNNMVTQIEDNALDIDSLYLNSYLFDLRTNNNSNEIENIKSNMLTFEDRLDTSDQDLNDLVVQINATSNALSAAVQNVINLEGALANLLNLEIAAREAADAILSNRIDSVEASSNSIPSVSQAKAMMMDLRAGSTTIDVDDGVATLSLSLEESSDLTSNWVERIESLEVDLPVTNNIEFFRFRMD